VEGAVEVGFREVGSGGSYVEGEGPGMWRLCRGCVEAAEWRYSFNCFISEKLINPATKNFIW
jgi:hypothetical protein